MDTESTSILIADDQADVRETLRLALKTAGYAVNSVDSPAAVLDFLRVSQCDALIMDLNYSRDTTSGQEGLELLRSVKQQEPDLPVLIITAWSNTELVVDAMQYGAADFIEKPWDNQRLLNIVSHLTSIRQQQVDSAALRAENRILQVDQSDTKLFAESAPMKALMSLVEDVASADANVLITGENGTGKTELARYIHQLSNRRDQRFVQVNIGALA